MKRTSLQINIMELASSMWLNRNENCKLGVLFDFNFKIYLRMNKTLIILCFFSFVGSSVFSQDTTKVKKTKDKVKITGSVQITHDFYSLSGNDIGHLNARRPSNLSRLILTPTFSWKKVTLPIEFVLSSQATNVVTPASRFNDPYSIFSQIRSFQDLVNYVSNPINRVSMSPIFGKFRINLGTHTPNYSELVQGNISMFGAGYEYLGNKFFTSFSWGITQPSVNQDTLNNMIGAYRREQYAFRVGFGSLRKNYVAFNVTGGKDNMSSVDSPLRGVRAEQGIAGSLQYNFIIAKHFSWESEMALSILTDDLNAFEIDFKELGINIPNVFPLNLSTRADIAGSTALGFKKNNVKIYAKALYVGAGYKSFGFPFFQSDRLELTLNPQFSFAKNKWFVNGSAGTRTNNLSGTKSAPMNQFIANINVNGRITDDLNVNASYGNFGLRNSVINDTFRVENIAQNINFTPSYTWTHEKSIDLFLMSYSHDRFEDFNVLTGNISNNQSNIFLVSWNRTLNNLPFSVGLSYSNFQFNSSFLQLSNQSVNVNWGYNFFKKRLRTNYSIGRLLNKPESNVSNDRQWIASLGIDYRSKTKYGFGLRWNTNNYIYGSARPNARFNENTLRFNLSKQF